MKPQAASHSIFFAVKGQKETSSVNFYFTILVRFQQLVSNIEEPTPSGYIFPYNPFPPSILICLSILILYNKDTKRMHSEFQAPLGEADLQKDVIVRGIAGMACVSPTLFNFCLLPLYYCWQ